MLAILGDLHLGPKELELVCPGIYKKQLSTLSRIVKTYNYKGCTSFFFLGDIFDEAAPDYKLEKAFIFWLKTHTDNGNTFHAIPGNHDFNSKKSYSLKTIDIINKLVKQDLITVYIKPEIVKFDETSVFICPHPYVEDMPRSCKYAFGHFAYSGAKGDNGFTVHTKYAPKGKWILGDFHTPQKGKNYIYAGSISQIKAHESPDKRTLLLEEGSISSIEHTPDYILSKIHISCEEDFSRLNPDTLYSVSFDSSFVTDKNWQVKYPNIIKVSVEGAKNRKAQVLIKAIQDDNPLTGLNKYIENSLGLSKEHAKRAFEILGIQNADI